MFKKREKYFHHKNKNPFWRLLIFILKVSKLVYKKLIITEEIYIPFLWSLC